MTFGVPADVAFEVLNDEAIVLNLTNGVYYQLSEVGTVIWEHLAKDGELGPAVDAVLEEFDVDRQTAEADALELIEDLKAKGLLLER